MKYGLIGKKLSHSYSKVIHGFLGNENYELVEIAPDKIESFLRGADFKGINVTIPYKEKVMPYCVLDSSAKEIGSVNTIVNRNGVLYGYNTDYSGFSYMARRADVSFNGKKVVILGSGGTSKTAAAVSRGGGAKEIVIVSRGGENNYDNIAAHADCNILINTTPLGMFPDTKDAPLSLRETGFKDLSAVIDVIYNPLMTKLLLEARELGIPAVNGLVMLTAQAVCAHNLFFGVDPCADGKSEAALIEETFSKTEKRFSNIVLTGMPGSGKTTIGMELAARLEKDFVDTDLVIEKETGKKIPDIILEEGEAYFRELERGVISREAALTGRVIATGGGSVLLKENRDALARNGVVVFLRRPLEKLAREGRPLSVDMEALYRKRLPLYESISRHKIGMVDDIAANVRAIIEALK